MKSTLPLLLLALFSFTHAWAQTPRPPGAPPPEESIDEDVLVGSPPGLRGQAKGGGLFNAQVSPGRGGGTRNFRMHLGGGGSGLFASAPSLKEKPLFIPSGKVEEATRAEIEEDLTIMGKLLDDAISGEKESRQAMGISVQNIFGTGTARQMQLEGFGVIFQANVRYPLSAPSSRDESERTNTTSNSAWDQARQQIYGGGPTSNFGEGGVAFEEPEFNAGKVESLKKSILETLVNAGNMRHVKSQETITVAVRSGGGEGVGHLVVNAFAMSTGPDGNIRAEHSRTSGSAMMIIRVKKADVDLLAKGKLSQEEFAKKATILFQ